MTAIALPARARLDPRESRRIALIGLLVAGVLLYLVFRGTGTLPINEDSPVFRTLTDARNTIRDDRPPLLEAIGALKGPVGWLATTIINALQYVGWLGVVGLATAVGWLTGGWKLAVLALAGLMAVGALGLWDLSMATLGLTAAAVILSLAVGIPLGILAARNRRLNAFLTPILDVMQIMPAFAYLAPLTLFFGIGAGAAVIATMIYAMPAAIRITALGIRRVPATTVEAASSLGATGWQLLRKVQLPLARRVIALAVNQTIMLALGMVVITVLIDAPGLGVPIYRALSGGRVGAAFEAGIAVVILAIVLDRLTERLSVQAEVTPNAVVDRAAERRARRIRLGIGATVAIAAIAISLNIDPTFPSAIGISLAGGVNDAVEWIKDNLTQATEAIKTVFSVVLLNPFQGVLTSSPWWLVLAFAVVLGWIVSGVRPAITAGVALVAMALLGLWEDSMVTLASVLVAILASLVIGIVLGILAARSRWFSAVLRPILDFFQTMPSFVYLLPAVALFGPSRVTGIFAALIYAVPPVIRLVEAGLRAVPSTLIEAGTAAGATERQLLTKVRLPASAPALLLAVNQGIVMVLAMVVVGALVGAGALGYDVIAGFAQSEDYGKGLAAAISIVLLGIMLDRITQGAGNRPRLRQAAG
ncbi:MAG TPA: ABC transporter permease subunit [Candidatus Limnocylindrales bacterium]|nr:ABC transporter permease subunit [Candidatus Limnocylindrales bacterium]